MYNIYMLYVCTIYYIIIHTVLQIYIKLLQPLFQREAYPLGFFVVLVVKGEDTDCNGLSSSDPLRVKNVTLIVNPTITKRDYVVASASAAAIVLGFCVSYMMAVIVFNIRESKRLAAREPINEQSQDVNEHIPSPSMVEEVTE